MGCLEKLEAEVEINSPASKLHQTFHARPYHMCNASPNKLQSCKLLEGEWGKIGSVLLWNFVHGLLSISIRSDFNPFKPNMSFK